MESIILQDEPDFEFLKDVIRGYNRDVQKLQEESKNGIRPGSAKSQNMRNGMWRKGCMQEAFAMLLRVVYTHDRGTGPPILSADLNFSRLKGDAEKHEGLGDGPVEQIRRHREPKCL